ncbi:hypothetical protein RUM43_001584 [Polyplax serrata]|uniref:Uncharacterized protein n=1 Tax=Polyplax serrata TaxID=468196 RepID=A0AAN8XQ10_POLSC
MRMKQKKASQKEKIKQNIKEIKKKSSREGKKKEQEQSEVNGNGNEKKERDATGWERNKKAIGKDHIRLSQRKFQ